MTVLGAAGHALLILMDPHRLLYLFAGVCMGLGLGILPGIGGNLYWSMQRRVHDPTRLTLSAWPQASRN